MSLQLPHLASRSPTAQQGRKNRQGARRPWRRVEPDVGALSSRRGARHAVDRATSGVKGARRSRRDYRIGFGEVRCGTDVSHTVRAANFLPESAVRRPNWPTRSSGLPAVASVERTGGPSMPSSLRRTPSTRHDCARRCWPDPGPSTSRSSWTATDDRRRPKDSLTRGRAIGEERRKDSSSSTGALISGSGR